MLPLWAAFPRNSYSPYSASAGGATGSGGGSNGVQATRADAFINTIGANFHFDYTPYLNLYPVLEAAAQDIGIRLMRAGAMNSDLPIGNVKSMATNAGMKFIFVAAPASQSGGVYD